MATENLICFQVLILFAFPLRTADSATFSLHTQIKGLISKNIHSATIIYNSRTVMYLITTLMYIVQRNDQQNTKETKWPSWGQRKVAVVGRWPKGGWSKNYILKNAYCSI